MPLSHDEILERIPHRPPMLLLDEIIESSDDRILGRKTFTGQEPFFQGHYPQTPIVPGVILCEAGMQCGAVLLADKLEHQAADAIPVATRLNQVKFKRIIRPGDTIDIDVQLRERLADAFYLDCRIRCAGKIAVSFEFACTLANGVGDPVFRGPTNETNP